MSDVDREREIDGSSSRRSGVRLRAESSAAIPLVVRTQLLEGCCEGGHFVAVTLREGRGTAYEGGGDGVGPRRDGCPGQQRAEVRAPGERCRLGLGSGVPGSPHEPGGPPAPLWVVQVGGQELERRVRLVAVQAQPGIERGSPTDARTVRGRDGVAPEVLSDCAPGFELAVVPQEPVDHRERVGADREGRGAVPTGPLPGGEEAVPSSDRSRQVPREEIDLEPASQGRVGIVAVARQGGETFGVLPRTGSSPAARETSQPIKR